jgi:hypothetical protein
MNHRFAASTLTTLLAGASLWVAPLSAPWWVPAALAAQSPATPAALTGAPSAGEYVGPGSCQGSNCHSQVDVGTEYDILQTEFSSWLEDDHAHAFEDLGNELSLRIARNLELDAPWRSEKCLACHSVSADAEPFILENGVSCEACHGPAGGWVQGHARRSWTHVDSLAVGMIDLRDVSLRARTCLACHQGDERREVDHELLAAGHPELVFELYTGESSVPHWKPFDALRERQGRRDTHGVVAWAVGQVEAFRQGLAQLERHTRAQVSTDFAELTCESCHHSLADSRWRQQREQGYPYRSGVPAWNLARWVVLQELVAQMVPDEYPPLEEEVRNIAAWATLGSARSGDLAAATGRARLSLARVLDDVDGATYDSVRLRSLILAILGGGGSSELDRQSADQIALSTRALVAGLEKESAEPLDEGIWQAVDALLLEIDDADDFDRHRFQDSLHALELALR